MISMYMARNIKKYCEIWLCCQILALMNSFSGENFWYILNLYFIYTASILFILYFYTVFLIWPNNNCDVILRPYSPGIIFNFFSFPWMPVYICYVNNQKQLFRKHLEVTVKCWKSSSCCFLTDCADTLPLSHPGWEEVLSPLQGWLLPQIWHRSVRSGSAQGTHQFPHIILQIAI